VVCFDKKNINFVKKYNQKYDGDVVDKKTHQIKLSGLKLDLHIF